MRKSVLFLIGIVFIVSIVVVTFFGMKISFDQFKIYINEIEITNFDREIRGNKYKTVYFNETEGFTTIFIEYKIGPVDASDPDAISFTLSNHTYEDENGARQLIGSNKVPENFSTLMYLLQKNEPNNIRFLAKEEQRRRMIAESLDSLNLQ